MNTVIITTIFQPSEAVKKFAHNKKIKLIVVGDKKTPSNWLCENVYYLSVEQQEISDYSLAKTLPYNHYCRKMIGYLEAINLGADLICDTDDDNIPYDNWDFPNLFDEFDYIETNRGFINIYQLFTKQNIWPRGLPLRLINTEFKIENYISKQKSEIGIWQGLADEDPDVDAIYRLTSNKLCFFNKRAPVVLGVNTICPINSQNTLFRKELFPLLYLPSSVTFRYTDILRGLIAQPIMWIKGFHLGFIGPTVIQKRNQHNFMADFESEIPMYSTCEKVIELVTKSISVNDSIENNIFNSYNELNKKEIVRAKELQTLEAWLNDLNKIHKI